MSSTTIPLPAPATLTAAAKLAIDLDKPIQMDYWNASSVKEAMIAETSGVQVLIKSADEYTSPIQKLYKKDSDAIIVVTENTIYLVSQRIEMRAAVAKSSSSSAAAAAK